MNYNSILRRTLLAAGIDPRTRTAAGKTASLSSYAKALEGLARAYWVAGFLGDNPRKAENWKKYLAKANPMLVAAGFPQEEANNWTSPRNMGFLDQSVQKIKGKVKGDIGGIGAEDVLAAVLSGLSPITGDPLRGGKPYPYIMGSNANGKTYYMGVTAQNLGEYAKTLANDVLKRTKSLSQKDTFSGDQFVQNEGDARETILDLLADEGVDQMFFSNLIFDPKAMRVIQPKVRAKIKNEMAKNIWDLIAQDPDLLKVKGDKTGLRRKEIAKMYSEAFNVPLTRALPDTLGNNWAKQQDAVIQAIQEVLSEDKMLEYISESADLESVLRSERSRRAQQMENNMDNFQDLYIEIEKTSAFKRIKEENPKEPLLIKLKSGAQMPPVVILRGYRDGIEMARKDKNVQDVYGGEVDKDNNPLEVMDWMYKMLGYWLAHAERAEKKGEEYMLTRKQKATLNKGLGGTKGILGPYLRVALRYACMKDGMCDLTTLPSETDKFKILANTFREINAALSTTQKSATKKTASRYVCDGKKGEEVVFGLDHAFGWFFQLWDNEDEPSIDVDRLSNGKLIQLLEKHGKPSAKLNSAIEYIAMDRDPGDGKWTLKRGSRRRRA